MPTIIRKWLKIWIPVLFLLGAGVFYYLITNWGILDAGTRFVAIFYVLLPFHCLEEWKLPGGFHYNYNLLQKSSLPDRYPMNQLSDMWTIFLAELLGIICLLVGVNEIIVIWHITFCFLEMTGHLIFGVTMYQKFKSVGKKILYNPGFVTAVLFTVHAVSYMLTQFPLHLPSLSTVIIGILLGLLAVGGVAFIPEIFFKDKETAYPFESNRYYEKFIKRGFSGDETYLKRLV